MTSATISDSSLRACDLWNQLPLVAENHFARVLTAIFPYALSSLFLPKAPKNAENQNGMLVAQSTAIAFVPTKTLGVVNKRRRNEMLWTIFVILLVLWLLGLVSGYAVGGFIHILLVIALVVLLINIIGGRRPVV